MYVSPVSLNCTQPKAPDPYHGMTDSSKSVFSPRASIEVLACLKLVEGVCVSAPTQSDVIGRGGGTHTSNPSTWLIETGGS